ncbi:MAG: RDD family protein [Chloroflexota bacterium]
MSWQTPDGDPPPEPRMPPSEPVEPEPDAETARFPVDEPAALPPEPAPTQPPAGLISAQPTGWVGPDAGASNAPADGPVVAWAAPVAPAATAVAEGVVIARVFPRVVAYFADSFLLGAIATGVSGLLGLYDTGRNSTLALGIGIAFVGLDFLYFVGFWTSPWQATLGMRLLRLRVLGAQTAGTLSLNDAVLRWIALSGAVSIITLVPGLGSSIGLITLLWLLALLATTAMHPLRQGLHDRWARSVVVQPAPGGSGLAIVTCLALVVLIGIVLPVTLLALGGDQLRDILKQIGDSI